MWWHVSINKREAAMLGFSASTWKWFSPDGSTLTLFRPAHLVQCFQNHQKSLQFSCLFTCYIRFQLFVFNYAKVVFFCAKIKIKWARFASIVIKNETFLSIFKHCDRLLGTENSYFCGEKEQNERIKASFEKNTTTYSWSSYSGQASMTENINISAK